MNARHWGLLVAIAGASCGTERITLVTRDNDDFSIAEPEYDVEGDYIWSDGAYYMSIHQLKKVLNLAWWLTKVGIVAPEEAENVNSLDELPDSTWFTNRHGIRRIGAAELARGPGPDRAPPTPWTVVKGKDLGISPGFVAKAADGALLFVKFDPAEYPGMGSNADYIVSRFLHAAGYNVPAYFSVLVDPGSIALDPTAMIPGQYKVKRPMTRADLDAILAAAPRVGDKILAGVSLGLPGTPKGPFRYDGLRADDPNDTVRHENRRELRGLQLLMAWLNNTDARRGNTLDMYVEEDGKRFLRHYLIDFSASLGSSNIRPKNPFQGHEYDIDPSIISSSLFAFGVWVKPWELPADLGPGSVGRFDVAAFEPDDWRGSYSNPAFELRTDRDAFWAAKIITSFTDDDIATIVAGGFYTDVRERDHLARVLVARRDKIGREWFSGQRISPLDGFAVDRAADGTWVLRFVDLGVDRGYVPEHTSRYRYRTDGRAFQILADSPLPLPDLGAEVEVAIETLRPEDHWGPLVAVLIQSSDGVPAVVRVSR